jgi:CRISPR/Cas system-associated exonuclease Cas4 (RecB family)
MAEIKVRTEGRVKRMEYLKYLANVRAEEQKAVDMGYRITRKSIEEVREEFVRNSNFDSIYIKI